MIRNAIIREFHLKARESDKRLFLANSRLQGEEEVV